MLFTGSKAVSMCFLTYSAFIRTLHLFSLSFCCLLISLLSLLVFGHWQGFQPGAGFPWRNPHRWKKVPSGEKSKPEQEKDETGMRPEARSQGDSSRTRPHVRLGTVPLDGLRVAATRTGTRTAWGNSAEDWKKFFLAHGWVSTQRSPFLLPCTTVSKIIYFP